jgi:hypothetical protein
VLTGTITTTATVALSAGCSRCRIHNEATPMSSKHKFRSIKDATFDAILPPNTAPDRVGLIAAGKLDGLREAMTRRHG